jgi:hypothetical protein
MTWKKMGGDGKLYILHKFEGDYVLLVSIVEYDNGQLVFNLEIMSEKEVMRWNDVVLVEKKERWVCYARVRLGNGLWFCW